MQRFYLFPFVSILDLFFFFFFVQERPNQTNKQGCVSRERKKKLKLVLMSVFSFSKERKKDNTRLFFLFFLFFLFDRCWNAPLKRKRGRDLERKGRWVVGGEETCSSVLSGPRKGGAEAKRKEQTRSKGKRSSLTLSVLTNEAAFDEVFSLFRLFFLSFLLIFSPLFNSFPLANHVKHGTRRRRQQDARTDRGGCGDAPRSAHTDGRGTP